MAVTVPDEQSGSSASAEPVVLRLSGDVDALSQQSYRAVADELLSSRPAQQLLVDMTDVETIDSSGLGLLVHLHTLTRTRNMTMTVTNIPARAQALLKRTGLDKVFGTDDVTSG